ncbi:MAG: transglutaminase family protein [Roseobacter sp.]
MKYNIRLKITHKYNHPAANSRHSICVIPKSIPQRQHLTTHVLDVLPDPGARFETVDFFHNKSTVCSLMDAHEEMTIQLACHVQMIEPVAWFDLSPTVQELRSTWENHRDLSPASPLHFLGPTQRLVPDDAITKFAKDIFVASESVANNVIRFGQALHDMMIFDSTATTVDTEASDAFTLKRGVCQDFSHIMILGLQALGIPAGYVSGYLRTLPPKGGVKLEGADAMHAWVRAWCGSDQGWIEYDPTNATLVGMDHIVVGYGRDYADVSPVSGHLRSSGGQQNSQAVDVTVIN